MKATRSPVVVLDAANIVTLVRGSIRLERLQNAIEHFEALGVRVIAFAPGYWLRSKTLTPRTRSQSHEIEQSEMVQFQQLVDDEKVVLTPPQAHDDLFIIDYAMKHGGYVVTNDMYRDHVANKMEFHGKELTEMWVKTHCITFTFVGSEFLPSAQHIQHLRSISCRNEEDKSMTRKSTDRHQQRISASIKQGSTLRIKTKISTKAIPKVVDPEEDSDIGVERRSQVRESRRAGQPRISDTTKHAEIPVLKPVAKLQNRYDNLEDDTTSSSASDDEKPNAQEKSLMQDWMILQKMIAHHQDQTITPNSSNEECVVKVLSPSQKRKLRRRKQAKKTMVYRVRESTSSDSSDGNSTRRNSVRKQETGRATIRS